MLLNKWPMYQGEAADLSFYSLKFCNKYLYFFEKGIPQITNTVIQDLIELIRTEKQNDSSASDPSAEAFFASTLRYIEFQKQKGGSIGEKYEQIP
eukprot:UN11131